MNELKPKKKTVLKSKDIKFNGTVKVNRLTREMDPVRYDRQLSWLKKFLSDSDRQTEGGIAQKELEV